MRKLYAVAAAAFPVFAVQVQHAEAGAWKRYTDEEAREHKDKLTGEIKKFKAKYSVRASSLDGGLEVQVTCNRSYPDIWFNSKLGNFSVLVDYEYTWKYKKKESPASFLRKMRKVRSMKIEYDLVSEYNRIAEISLMGLNKALAECPK